MVRRLISRRSMCWQIAAWWLLLPVCTESAETLLRWKFAAGESLKYQSTQSTQTETAGTGKPMRIAMETSMTVTWKVDSVDASHTATITQTIDSFRLSMTTDKLEPIVYDSTAKTAATGPAREIADAVGKLVGTSCQIQLTERGDITLAEPSEPLRVALQSAAKNGAGQPLSPEAISASLRQVAGILPEKPVTKGGTWESQREVNTPSGTMLQRNQFTYQGLVEHDGAKADSCTLDATFSLAKAGDKNANLTIKEGQQTGTIWFDSMAGRLVSSEVSQKLVTERPYRDTVIQVQSSSKLVMKLLK